MLTNSESTTNEWFYIRQLNVSKYLFAVCECFACSYVCAPVIRLVSEEAREGIRSPEPGVTDSYEL